MMSTMFAADPEWFCEIEAELDELDPLNRNLAPDEIRSSVNLAVDAAALMFDALEATETIEVWIEGNCESTP
jgi:hypothetical protein